MFIFSDRLQKVILLLKTTKTMSVSYLFKYLGGISLMFYLLACSPKNTEITLKASNVKGLSNETNLTIDGQFIGGVHEMKIANDGSIAVSCYLKNEKDIPFDSEFIIQNSLLGEDQIAIILGTSDQFIRSGDVFQLNPPVPFKIPETLQNQVLKVLDNMQTSIESDTVLMEWHKVNHKINDFVNDMNQLKQQQ